MDPDDLERELQVTQERLGRLERLFLVHMLQRPCDPVSKEHAEELVTLLDDHHEDIDPSSV